MISVERIQQLELEPGDTLVITVPRDTSSEDLKNIAKTFHQLLKNRQVKVLVTHIPFELQRVKAEPHSPSQASGRCTVLKDAGDLITTGSSSPPSERIDVCDTCHASKNTPGHSDWCLLSRQPGVEDHDTY